MSQDESEDRDHDSIQSSDFKKPVAECLDIKIAENELILIWATAIKVLKKYGEIDKSMFSNNLLEEVIDLTYDNIIFLDKFAHEKNTLEGEAYKCVLNFLRQCGAKNQSFLPKANQFFTESPSSLEVAQISHFCWSNKPKHDKIFSDCDKDTIHGTKKMQGIIEAFLNDEDRFGAKDLEQYYGFDICGWVVKKLNMID